MCMVNGTLLVRNHGGDSNIDVGLYYSVLTSFSVDSFMAIKNMEQTVSRLCEARDLREIGYPFHTDQTDFI